MVDVRDTLSAQVAVIGSLLLEPKLLGEALLKVSDQDFLSGKCRLAFQVMRKLFTAGEAVDPVTVRDKLGGDPADEWDRFLMQAMEATPTAAHIWTYTELMRDQARLHRINALSGQLQEAADLDTAQMYIAKLNNELCDQNDVEIVSLRQGLVDFMDRIDKPRNYVTWGLEGLDGNLYAECQRQCKNARKGP